MKESLKLIVFILILGAISALVLIGVDALTAERIKANRLLDFQKTVLAANEDSLDGDLNARFNEVMFPAEVDEESGLTIYVHKASGNISFEYEGNGLWDKIKGVMTLKSDWKTIVDVTVLQQGETPGLGALVAERKFLDTLTGKVFNPTITIKKDAEGDSEVDSISGATGTSSQFQVILNNSYKAHYEAFVGELVLVEEDELFEAILVAHGITFDENSNLGELIKENFKVFTEGELKVYVNKTTGRITFAEIHELLFALDGIVKEEIMIIITLENDFKTIFKLQTLDDGNTSHWGKTNLLKQEELDKIIGKVFPDVYFVPGKNTDKEVDGGAGVTFTRTSLNVAINDMYNKHYEAFKDVDFDVEVVEDLTFFEKVLDFYDITPEGYVSTKETFENYFSQEIKNGLTLYTYKGLAGTTDSNIGDKVYSFKATYSFGRENEDKELPVKEELETIIILESDLITVKKIIVLHDNAGGQWGKSRLFSEESLDKAIGKNFPDLTFKVGGSSDNEVDTEAGPTTTIREFNKVLNDVHTKYREAFLTLNHDQEILLRILTNNNIRLDLNAIKVNPSLLDELINNYFSLETFGDFDIYTNKINGDVTYTFDAKYSLGRGTPEDQSETLTTVVTLRNDLKTIVKITVIHDEKSAHWGKTRFFTEEILNRAIGRNITQIEFVKLDEINDYNDVDGTTGATKTRDEFNRSINEFYKDFYFAFNKVDESNYISAKILLSHNIYFSNNIEQLISENFDITIDGEIKIYTHKTTGNISYTFTETYNIGNQNVADDEKLTEEILTIVTLDKDLETVINLSVIFEEGRQWAKTRFFIVDVLQRAIGKNIKTLNFVDVVDKENPDDVDGKTGTTVTRDEFNAFLKSTHAKVIVALGKGE